MKVSRLAIIGLGSIGRRHLRIISEMRPDIEIVVVRSGNGSSTNEEKFAVKTLSSVNEAIDFGVEAAIISSPATVHLQQSLDFANEGVHLLIEKPLSHSLEGVQELLKVEKDKNIVAMVGYVLRYDIGANKFKEWLIDKRIGKILHARIECGSYLPDWRQGQDYRKTVSAINELGGGALLELSHEIDYLHWFFGDPLEAQAQLNNTGILDIDVEDQVDMLVRSEKNFPISVQIDFNRLHAKRECTVITSTGELKWNAIEKKVIWRPLNAEKIDFAYNSERDDLYKKQLNFFFQCIESGAKSPASINDGIKTLKLIDAARHASKSGLKVYL
ncbi:Gfo/Idh/MocA family oxidoreductase [Candidatus Thioglobus sp.]|nr:Gfo/Idh/MocA family oxidoreductase [Candidatus Thioglobus sp.]